MLDQSVPYVDLKDAAPLFGLTFNSAKNAISRSTFPVPTYRLGRLRVIDKQVIAAFFEQKKAAGLAQLLEKRAGGDEKPALSVRPRKKRKATPR